MKELFSLFPILFQANSLFSRLVILVQKVKIVEFYSFFTPIFSNSHALFTRSWASRMKQNQFNTFFTKNWFFNWLLLFSMFIRKLREFHFILKWKRFYFILWLCNRKWNNSYFIFSWNEIKPYFISFHTTTLLTKFVYQTKHHSIRNFTNFLIV